MPTIPPGTALDAAMRKRLEDLQRLVQGATYRLMSIQRDLEDAGSRRYVNARIRESFRIIDALYAVRAGNATGALHEWAREHFPATYISGARMAARDLAAQSITAVSGDSRIHGAAVEALLKKFADDAIRTVVVPLKASAIRSARVVLAESGFAEDIAAGIIGGLPRTETSALLRRTLLRAVNEVIPEGAEPDLTAIEIDGRRWNLDSWIEMEARTETARASTAGTRTMAAVNGVRHIQITSHAHNPCICTPFEGRIYALDPADTRFPHIGVVPGGGCPMHPNCVHRETPAVVDYLEERGDVKGRDTLPSAFVGMSTQELARTVRANRKELARFSERRDGYLPGNFRLREAA